MDDRGTATFWRELARRNVLRVGAAYAVASFAIIEVVSNIAPAFSLPDWTLKLVIVLLALAFPVAVVFAWVYEITPDGLRRTEEIEHNASITHRTAHRLNIVTIVLVLLLAGLYSVDRFLPARQTAEAGSAAAPQNAAAGVSIAVLPFVNLSGDPNQEFFSDGMTEEITSALAKVKGLRVVGRTSAFEFKGQNKDLRAIGQALGAANLLEGSVRKVGNRVRITGQLIRAADGSHIWTENYDRELTDVFATQDDIAQAIAGALQRPLGLKAGESLVASRDISPESYQDYLRAKAMLRARGTVGGKHAIEAASLLEQALSQNPDYAPAWSLLAAADVLAPQETSAALSDSAEELRRVAESFLTKGEAAGRRAIELDPRSADAYAALGYIRTVRGMYLGAEDLFRQALTIDAGNLSALHWYSLTLCKVGRTKECLAMRRQLGVIEPLVPRYNANTAHLFWQGEQFEAALEIAKALPANDKNRVSLLPRIYASMGRYADAANAILSAPPEALKPGVAEASVRLLRRAPAAAAPKDLPDLPDELSFVYLSVGAHELFIESALSSLEREFEAGYQNKTTAVYSQSFALARKTERFKAFVRKAGFVEYWRARGWPDVCHPVGADDFECS